MSSSLGMLATIAISNNCSKAPSQNQKSRNGKQRELQLFKLCISACIAHIVCSGDPSQMKKRVLEIDPLIDDIPYHGSLPRKIAKLAEGDPVKKKKLTKLFRMIYQESIDLRVRFNEKLTSRSPLIALLKKSRGAGSVPQEKTRKFEENIESIKDKLKTEEWAYLVRQICYKQQAYQFRTREPYTAEMIVQQISNGLPLPEYSLTSKVLLQHKEIICSAIEKSFMTDTSSARGAPRFSSPSSASSSAPSEPSMPFVSSTSTSEGIYPYAVDYVAPKLHPETSDLEVPPALPRKRKEPSPSSRNEKTPAPNKRQKRGDNMEGPVIPQTPMTVETSS